MRWARVADCEKDCHIRRNTRETSARQAHTSAVGVGGEVSGLLGGVGVRDVQLVLGGKSAQAVKLPLQVSVCVRVREREVMSRRRVFFYKAAENTSALAFE